MSIEGSLATMSVADLFQILGTGRKTGTVELHYNGAELRFVFTDGRLATVRPVKPPSSLADYLVHRGWISQAHYQKALAASDHGPGPVVETLLEIEALDLGTLKAAALEHCHELVRLALRWREGTFLFRTALDEDLGEMPLAVEVRDLLWRVTSETEVDA